MYAVKKRAPINPTRMITASFAAVILTGTLLLCLPISSKAREFTSLLDCLFTATSATCVTGLIVYDTYTHWSLFGQGVIMALIQVGGLGLVTFTSFFSLVTGKKLGLRGMKLASESVNSNSLSEVPDLLRMIITFTLTVEAIGAVLLGIYFVPEYGMMGVFISVFLAVSAFCNAGFDNLGFLGEYTSLTTFNDNYLVIFTIMALIVIGGLGFVVWNDLMAYRKTRVLLLHTKIVLMVTIFLILFGALGYLGLEWDNEKTMQALDMKGKIGAAFMQSITMRTAGFNSIDLYSMTDAAKVFSVVLMFIGAAPGSTGGGIKTTTFFALMQQVRAVFTKKKPGGFHRTLPGEAIDKAGVIALLSVVVVCVGTFLLCVLEPELDFVRLLFEEVSAFGTVGLSTGITPDLSVASKLVLIFTMYIGRLGAFTLFSLWIDRPDPSIRYTEEMITIG